MKAIIISSVKFFKGSNRYYTDPITDERYDVNIKLSERKDLWKKEGFKGILVQSSEDGDTYKFAAFVIAETERDIFDYIKKLEINGAVCFEKWERSYIDSIKALKEYGFNVDKLQTIKI